MGASRGLGRLIDSPPSLPVLFVARSESRGPVFSCRRQRDRAGFRMGRSVACSEPLDYSRRWATRPGCEILNLLGERDVCVCEMVEILRLRQSKVSRHLAALRHAGLVGCRREGMWVIISSRAASTPLHQQMRDWLMAMRHQNDRSRNDLDAPCASSPRTTGTAWGQVASRQHLPKAGNRRTASSKLVGRLTNAVSTS